MRKMLSGLVAAGFIMSVSAVMGQGTTNTTPSAVPAKADAVTARLEHLSKALSLTDEQKAKIKDIITASRDKVTKITDDAKAKVTAAGTNTTAATTARTDAQAQVKTIRTSEMDQIKAVLTPEQLVKFKEMHQAQAGKGHPAE